MTARSLLPALLALTACATPDDGAPPKQAPAPVAKMSQPLVPEDAAACGHRIVGRTDDITGCPPAVGGWVRVNDFIDPPPPATSDLGDRLLSYCVYDWVGAGDPVAPMPADSTGSDFAKPDCHVVGTATPVPITEALGPFVAETYRRGVAFPDTLPANALTTLLAVVDTSPTEWLNGAPGNGQFQHGRSVASAARELACKPAGCAIDIYPVLGLPRVDPKTVDTVNGGAFGYQSELAQGIYHAVSEWQDKGTGRLVINLSVGWESRFNLYMGTGSLPKGAVGMVYDALRYARCNGALIFAAAGNKGNSAYDDGPIFPAAWASDLAPDTTACAGIETDYDNDVRANPTDPLVIPVAGLTRHDAPLHNARNNTRTPLAGPGANIAVWDAPNGEMRPALTGSSMATAAVSAVAATMWAYLPETPPHVVINQLYASGVDLGVSADVCHVQSCPTSRRVSMCTALNALCNDPDSRCVGFQAQCSPILAGADFAPPVSGTERDDFIKDVEINHSAGSMSDTLPTYTDPCQPNPIMYDPALGPADPKCFDGVPGHRLRPWVDPQPDPNGCDICVFASPLSHVRFYHDPAKGGYTVTDAVLHLTDGVLIKSFDLSSISTTLASMNSGETYEFTINTSLTVKEGWIDYKADGVFNTDDVIIY